MRTETDGYGFFAESIKNYWNGNVIIPMLLICALLYMLHKKNKIWNRTMLWPFFIGCCTVFNPFVMRAVLEKLDWNNRYYRFYWLVPVTLIISVTAADLYSALSSKLFRAGWAVLLLASIVFFGKFIIAGTDHWNLYMMDYNVIEVSKIIHKDYKKQESPVVFVDANLLPCLRQYDPSLQSVLGLQDYISLSYSLDEVWTWYLGRNRGLVLMGNYGVEISPQVINVNLKQAGVDYFVRSKSWFSKEYIQALDILKIGETDGYEVYRAGR